MTRCAITAAVALSAAVSLAGCSGGTSTEAGAGSPAASSSAPTTSPSTQAAPVDLAAQQDCKNYELAYGTVRIKLDSADGSLEQAARGPSTPQLVEATSKSGADAESALAQLAQQALFLRIAADAGRPLDRVAFRTTWDQAKAACADVGYHFTV